MSSQTAAVGPVVVGIDGSEASLMALGRAIHEAGWRGVKLHVVHALDVTPAVLHLARNQTITTLELAQSDREEIWRRATPALERSETEFVKVDRTGNPGAVLAQYAAEVGASVLVVGPRGRGKLAKALLGSTAQRVLKEAGCDVLIVKS